MATKSAPMMTESIGQHKWQRSSDRDRSRKERERERLASKQTDRRRERGQGVSQLVPLVGLLT